MEEKLQAARFSARPGHAFPEYQMIGSMRPLSGGKNDAAIAAPCEKTHAGEMREMRAAASQIEEEESE